MSSVQVRVENEHHLRAIHEVNQAAFETPSEANLVDTLRKQARPVISLVAEEDGQVVGHIMFSPVSLSSHPDCKVMGLAPMAVAPAHQNKGIGSALVKAGIDQCKHLGYSAVVVLGHPNYYPRFGFSPASQFGIDSEYDVPDDVFMAMELTPEGLKGRSGSVKFHPAFSDV